MIAIVQRVSEGRVSVNGSVVGSCARGLFVLLGVAAGDSEEDAKLLAEKIIRLRIFSDENGKMNLALKDVNGEMLIVSNFTLLASYRKGNRPDYMNSAPPDEARKLYNFFVSYVKERVPRVGEGIFGADMQVSITNDGPVTIPMDSKVLKKTAG